MTPQSGIAQPIPTHGRYLTFQFALGADVQAALRALGERTWDERVVFGIGPAVTARLGKEIPGLAAFPVIEGAKVEVPSTQAAAWCWLRGTDPGELFRLGEEVSALLCPGFVVVEATDSFRYKEGRDLTGYVDGTENPDPDDIPEVAFLSGAGPGLDGGSFVSVQRWVHDLSGFARKTEVEKDYMFGRTFSEDEELKDAPPTAHVKRTEQEYFTPPAFLVRRGMPFLAGQEAGLMFVAFAASLRTFSLHLSRMVGAEDGVVDALFDFTRPVSGSQFFCPPIREGKLDLTSLL